jgi:uncharacterized protein YdeI (YjbR/CyaY-like superfamily)
MTNHKAGFLSGSEDVKPLDFRSAGEWRRWLERHRDKSQGEWVYMYKKDADRAGLRYQDALDEALCFGWIDGQIKAVDNDKFRQRWTPRRKGSIWSDGNKRRVRRLIADGRMTDAGLAAVRAAKKAGMWTADSPRSAAPLPADMAAALQSAAPAWENFTGFAPTYRLAYTWWVTSARQPATRQRRIAAVVRRSRENRKPGMESLYD